MFRKIGALCLISTFAGCVAEPDEASRIPANWIDFEAMDDGVRAADDFYSFVNGQWLAQTEIPDHLPWISPYVENYFEIRRRLEEIVQELAAQTFRSSSDRQRVGDLFRSYMDVATIERIGIKPLESILEQVDAAASPAGLAKLLAEFNRQHFRLTDNANKYAAPFVINVRPDGHDAAQMIAILDSAGLGMSSRESYVSNDLRHAEVRAHYLAHIEQILLLAGTEDAAARAARILELETTLARSTLTLTQLTDHAANYHRLSRSDLHELLPAFEWTAYLEAAGLADQDAFLVPDLDYFEALNGVLLDTSLDVWKAYLRWQLLRIYSPYLGDAFVKQDFAFFGQVELGNEVPMGRRELAIIVVEQAFSELMGRMYVERYFSIEDKQRVTVMAEAIRDQFRLSIRDLDWMGTETKRAALDKLSKINIKVGYPDVWQNYATVSVSPDDLIGNLMSITAAEYSRRIDALGRPIDRRVWQTPAYASSAYYYRVMNEIAIPAGYLLPPWYDRNAEPAMNYGGIGTVIGHEMGHAFDNQGSQYDGDGNLNEWWTEDDSRRFLERTGQLVEQYGQYSPAPGQFVDGELSLSENIGDLTGLTMAHRAFRSVADTGSAGGTFSADQRFFISFAMHWRAIYSDALLSRILSGDGHPPQKYRANGPLVNFTPFYESFGVSPGDGMFLPEADRVSIW